MMVDLVGTEYSDVNLKKIMQRYKLSHRLLRKMRMKILICWN